jgi:NADH-quinone oxidoreductase subunit L
LVVILAPTLLLACLGMASLLGLALHEQVIARLTQVAVILGATSAVAVLALMVAKDRPYVAVEVGNWVAIPAQNFHFHLKFDFNWLTLPFALLSFMLIGTVGAFSSLYLHREPGYQRFFLLYAMFLLGMVLASLAGTIETLFTGWELVGLSSALLVAFFHERTAPVRNGLRIWSIYRVADAAFLIAALALHHLAGGGDFQLIMGAGPWPHSPTAIAPNHALVVGLLLLIAAAGKSALVPFSGWLPRAMEGPTPSSAVFYGALSVHLGAFLLLRISPLLEMSLLLSAAVVSLGLLTAVYGTLCARVQTDVKSALAFAALTQVGIIVVEIGLGLRYLALAHIIGHACLRTLQLLRAPSLLQDYRLLENAIGERLYTPSANHQGWLPERFRIAIWRFGIDRGNLDNWLNDAIVRPFLWILHSCDRLERRWTDWITGAPSRESDQVVPHVDPYELTIIDEVDIASLNSLASSRTWQIEPESETTFPPR